MEAVLTDELALVSINTHSKCFKFSDMTSIKQLPCW